MVKYQRFNLRQLVKIFHRELANDINDTDICEFHTNLLLLFTSESKAKVVNSQMRSETRENCAISH